MSLVFTTIQHRFRKDHQLSCNEYVLMDMIYHLSTNPDANVRGWCYMSRVQMAEELNVTKQTILNLINKLVEKGFLEKDVITTFLKTTKKWNSVYFTNGKKSLPVPDLDGKEILPLSGKKSLPDDGKESLPYNNTLYNDNIDNTLFTEKKISVYAECMDLYNDFIILKTTKKARITKTTGSSLKKIIAYIQGNTKTKTEESVPIALKYIFDSYDLWDTFHKKNIELHQIESNLINILNAIKNGSPKPNSNTHSTGSRIDRENGVEKLVSIINTVKL